MDYILLVKQVPDVSNIPANAWDKEKGTLKRGVLDSVLNPLDLHALTFANNMKVAADDPYSRIIGLTMGPPNADDVLTDVYSRCADEMVLLTDVAFAGADTVATAYSLAQAIKKIEKEIIGNKNYIILSGMQSVDGDTAQVPPQVAEELGIEHIAYAQSFKYENPDFSIRRIGPNGMETIMPMEYPTLITVTGCTDTLYRQFHRSREASQKKIYVWNAAQIEANKARIGGGGSKTQVYKIYSPEDDKKKKCEYLENLDVLVEQIETKFKNGTSKKEEDSSAKYSLNGKKPTYSGEVWVFVEQVDSVINQVSYELIGKAKELASSLNEKVGAVILGNNISMLAKNLIAYGADKVYVADHESLQTFVSIPYKKTISELVKLYDPQIMLFGATPMGRELAPRVAYATQSGLTADCTKLEISDFKDKKKEFVAILKQTRPALGGNIMATIMTKNASTQMATVRPGVMKSKEFDTSRKGEVIPYLPTFNPSDFKTMITGIESVASHVSIAEADLIVAGGRGVGSKRKYDQHIRSLADAFKELLEGKIEVGASRMAVEDGLITHDHQVGQTGQTVRPKLYVAIGISGAVQHISGMQNSDIVLAINKDSKAKIFNFADYGIIGDFEKIVPELVEALKRRKK